MKSSLTLLSLLGILSLQPVYAAEVPATQIILDDTSAEFTAEGWVRTKNEKTGYLQNEHYIQFQEDSNKAVWNFENIPAGTYEVFTTWIPYSWMSKEANYTLVPNEESYSARTVTVDQSSAPNSLEKEGVQWQRLREMYVRPNSNGTRLTVELSTEEYGKYLGADAVFIRMVHPFDVNKDGTISSQDTLQAINLLEKSGAGPLGEDGRDERFDANSDGYFNELDIYTITQFLNDRGPTTLPVQSVESDYFFIHRRTSFIRQTPEAGTLFFPSYFTLLNENYDPSAEKQRITEVQFFVSKPEAIDAIEIHIDDAGDDQALQVPVGRTEVHGAHVIVPLQNATFSQFATVFVIVDSSSTLANTENVQLQISKIVLASGEELNVYSPTGHLTLAEVTESSVTITTQPVVSDAAVGEESVLLTGQIDIIGEPHVIDWLDIHIDGFSNDDFTYCERVFCSNTPYPTLYIDGTPVGFVGKVGVDRFEFVTNDNRDSPILTEGSHSFEVRATPTKAGMFSVRIPQQSSSWFQKQSTSDSGVFISSPITVNSYPSRFTVSE